VDKATGTSKLLSMSDMSSLEQLEGILRTSSGEPGQNVRIVIDRMIGDDIDVVDHACKADDDTGDEYPDTDQQKPSCSSDQIKASRRDYIDFVKLNSNALLNTGACWGFDDVLEKIKG
jgi:hypothetical protein